MNGHVRITVAGRRRVIDDYSRVSGDGAKLVDDQWIEVKLQQPGQFADHFGNVEQHFFKCFHVYRRFSTEFAEQLGGVC